MRPPARRRLVVAGLAAAAVAWLLISSFYGVLPPLPWLPTVTLAGLAVFEGYAAVNTKARIDRKPGREPVDPLVAGPVRRARQGLLLAGAIFAGFYAGLGPGCLLQDPSRAQRHPVGRQWALASLALVGAALWLERSCRVPERPEDAARSSGRTRE